MRVIRTILLILIGLCLSGTSALAGSGDIRMTLASGDDVRINRNDTGDWQYHRGLETYRLTQDARGNIDFIKGSQSLASGRFKGEKLLMTETSGTVFLEIKVSADKIKFAESASPSTVWELKTKADKIKLVYGGVDYGKVKYYPDTGKIKAKNRLGTTVAEVRGLSAITAAPGVILAESLTTDKTVFLVLFLMSIGR